MFQPLLTVICCCSPGQGPPSCLLGLWLGRGFCLSTWTSRRGARSTWLCCCSVFACSGRRPAVLPGVGLLGAAGLPCSGATGAPTAPSPSTALHKSHHVTTQLSGALNLSAAFRCFCRKAAWTDQAGRRWHCPMQYCQWPQEGASIKGNGCTQVPHLPALPSLTRVHTHPLHAHTQCTEIPCVHTQACTRLHSPHTTYTHTHTPHHVHKCPHSDQSYFNDVLVHQGGIIEGGGLQHGTVPWLKRTVGLAVEGRLLLQRKPPSHGPVS